MCFVFAIMFNILSGAFKSLKEFLALSLVSLDLDLDTPAKHL